MMRIALVLWIVFASCNEGVVEQRYGVLAKNGMVSTAHPEASKIGLSILREGGNAFDAAIAVQFALAVCYPVAGNIGGGGFAVIRKADGTVDALDFREKAPKAAHKDMYLDEKGNVISGSSLLGHLSVGVPGTVDGMVRLHEKYGRLSWEKLVEPSIELAYRGFVLRSWDAERLNSERENFLKVNRNPSAIVKEGGWKAGDTLRLPDLARTLERIRTHRRSGFYEGETARLLLEEMRRGQGIITQEDLDSYRAVWRKPLIGNYRGHRLITMPLPSSGGITLLQMLHGAEKYPLHTWGHTSTKHFHLLAELARRAYADRAAFLGDADFIDVPVDSLLSESYLRHRFADVSLEKKTDSQKIRQGSNVTIESYETTHFSIVDAERNAIAVTTTLNGYFGSKVMVEGAGFFLNNEMDDFSIKVGHPNQFGLIGSPANAIAPEKRMLSSMTPTIVEKDGTLRMVVGTPGGSTIITGVYQVIVNVIDFRMTMKEAVDAP
ncbi:MAG: gamma-glutamyltransferase, partial [Flammeovirgaceae bacterium]|nr:gamma-glutamyltransferase [Flammeovirgaceae bacterium]MDW8288145.1 gamma-glutamyltransferase [Flammeovirgaceae bacterium]